MPTYDRSGSNRDTLKLDRWFCLRQELMHPGERWKPSVSGFIEFAPLRERHMEPVHVSLVVTWTPLRWLVAAVPDMVKEGVDTSRTFTKQGYVAGPAMGIGHSANYHQFWRDNYYRVYNEHFKWPEDSDLTPGAQLHSEAAFTASNGLDVFEYRDFSINALYGHGAVPLAHRATRLWKDPGEADASFDFPTEAGSGGREKFDIRALERLRAKLRTEQRKHWSAVERYREILKDIYGVDGNREVDKVPVVLDDHSGWMQGSNLQATDGRSLGMSTGLMAFGVDYRFPFSFQAPEHGIFAYFICMRMKTLFAGEKNWLSDSLLTTPEILGMPEYYVDRPVKAVKGYAISNAANATNIVGYEPDGQEWRTGWNKLDVDYVRRNTFPFRPNPIPLTTVRRDASGYSDNFDRIFRSASLGNATCKLEFKQITHSHIPGPGQSIYAGI